MSVAADPRAPVATDGLARTAAQIEALLARLDRPCYVVRAGDGVGLRDAAPADPSSVVAAVGPMPPERLGSAAFRRDHGVRLAYMAGAMAGGVASEELVVALSRAGLLASFGAAGLSPDRIERALERFAREIPRGPFACNLIHSPHEAALERAAVDLYLRAGVRCVEASAFMELTPEVVRYRVAGLERAADGRTVARNRVVAKVSREEVAERFLRPAPEAIVRELVERGAVTAEQGLLARTVAMADDLTAEADSGGHTDRRSLVVLLPAMIALRDRIAGEGGAARAAAAVRIGAAGGIGTPSAAWAAFAMGAAYVVTGSVNQSCRESGTSDAVRALLRETASTDVAMAPAADMFELGVDLQVLRRGTLFPMRAKKLYALYAAHPSLDAIPAREREALERDLFGRPVEEVWQECVRYFGERDPDQIARAHDDPRRKMALVFRWYLGMSSRWASGGAADRRRDYQVWCGPAMGAFNDWVRGSALEHAAQRSVGAVAEQIMRGAAFEARRAQLVCAGVGLPAAVRYRPPGAAELTR